MRTGEKKQNLRLSIVVPVLDDPARMNDTLVSILENRPEDCEIIVVLNGPYDDPYDLKHEVTFLEAPRTASLVECINRGIAVSGAPVVHVLGCGLLATSTWADVALSAFADPALAAVVPVAVDRLDVNRIVSGGAKLRRWGSVVQLPGQTAAESHPVVADPDVFAVFVRKAALPQFAPVSRAVGDRLALLDLTMKLKAAGGACRLAPASRVVGLPADALPNEGAIKSGLYAERLYWRWLPQLGGWWTVPLHGAAVLSELVTTIVRPSNLLKAAGRLAALFSLRRFRDHWRRIAVASAKRALPAPSDAPSQSPRLKRAA